MECPHCSKPVKVPDVAFANAENYGGGTYIFKHEPCGKMIRVSMARYAKVTLVQIAQTLSGTPSPSFGGEDAVAK